MTLQSLNRNCVLYLHL